MKLLGALRTYLVRGFFVLLPVILAVLVLQEVFAIAVGAIGPIADAIGTEELRGIEVSLLLALAAIFVAFLSAGYAVDTIIGVRIGAWFERSVLNRLPGYTLLKNLAGRFSPQHQGSVVLARLAGNGASSLAFLVETLSDGRCVVFVPVSPTPSIGFIYVVPAEDVEPIGATTAATMNALMQWGIGTGDLIGARPHAATANVDAAGAEDTVMRGDARPR